MRWRWRWGTIVAWWLRIAINSLRISSSFGSPDGISPAPLNPSSSLCLTESAASDATSSAAEVNAWDAERCDDLRCVHKKSHVSCETAQGWAGGGWGHHARERLG